jgi:DNA-directed RNA polymerase specialized sigma24 family protein
MPADEDRQSARATPEPNARRDELRTLTARCVAGDAEAFNQLAARLRPALARLFVEKFGAKPALADDLAQRTLLGLWQALSHGRYDAQRSAVTTFAFAVAHKIWLQHARAAGRASSATPGSSLANRPPPSTMRKTTRRCSKRCATHCWSR